MFKKRRKPIKRQVMKYRVDECQVILSDEKNNEVLLNKHFDDVNEAMEFVSLTQQKYNMLKGYISTYQEGKDYLTIEGNGLPYKLVLIALKGHWEEIQE